MLTCKDCVFNQGSINHQTKEMQRQCTRYPPNMYMIPTAQGIVGQVTYPMINNDFLACGEYYDGEDSDNPEIAH